MQKFLSVRRAALLLSCCAATISPHAWAEEPDTEDAGTITVTGRRISQSAEAIGEDKVSNVVGVTREALLSAPSGISGLKMLEQLPGFNVQTDGPLGLYEFGNSVQVRAFNLDQIGFVVDGIPTGRSDAFGGSPVFRYVDNENLGVVEAAPGAGDVGLPSYSSLGPIISYKSIAPQDEIGLFVSQSFGDNDLKRTFIRFNTGQVGPFKAYVSRTKLDSDLWRGAGSVDREHWEAQLHADLGGDSWARFKFVSNDFFDYDSPFLSRALYNSTTPSYNGKTGRDIGYIVAPPNTTPGYQPTAAGIAYSNSAYINSYNLAINVRQDKLYGATLHLGIADNAWFESTAYWEDKGGYGVSPDSYSNSRSIYIGQVAIGLPVNAPRGTQFGRSGVGGNRYGITTKFHIDLGNHSIETGVWAELDKYHRTQARYNTTDGSPASPADLNSLVFLRRDYRSERNITQAFLKDTAKFLDDRLIVDVGFKALSMDYDYFGYRDYADYYRNVGTTAAPRYVAGWGRHGASVNYTDGFLPMAGLIYKLDGRSQIFASYAENTALPKGMDDIYSVVPSTGVLAPKPKAEKSKNFELGFRTNQAEFYGALAAYYTKFDNRIAITAIPLAGSTVLESVYTNVGRVEAYGAEFTGTYKPAFLNGLAYFSLNATYNHAKFKDNLPNGTALAGKYLPDSAKWIVNGGVTVEPASWLVANFSGKYTSSRWSTLVNTPGSSIPGFTIFSAYVDIGDGITLGPVKGVKARFNLDNVFDKDTLSFISPSTSGDGNFRPQSPRTFQFTISGEI
ncbi:TonB-dependent receptor [Sphingobium chlorophenolicum L-1]|uniref:TonB-dependent receptor n=1 Tax=Sphingobium chlorophenolicum L-1 TaxID=690566 RepID=F6EVY6_SPHCR|nr:TonB-dependent receptor [Sphingobium chlorophenolicum]AEG48032.1 TonB-dependent receptor [Sphingobium chlorophenolicum L-1]